MCINLCIRKSQEKRLFHVECKNAVAQNSANSEVTPWKKVLLKL